MFCLSLLAATIAGGGNAGGRRQYIYGVRTGITAPILPFAHYEKPATI